MEAISPLLDNSEVKPKPASGVIEITTVDILGFAANEPRVGAGCVGSCVYDASDELFPGQYFDEETQLHYNYFRYYDPKLGRYLRSDPIGILRDYSDPQLQLASRLGHLEQGDFANKELNHLYAYVMNNPLTYSDPSGLEQISEWRSEVIPEREGSTGLTHNTVRSQCRVRCPDGSEVDVTREWSAWSGPGIPASELRTAKRASASLRRILDLNDPNVLSRIGICP